MRAVLKIGGGILRDKNDLDTLVKILKLNSDRENILVVSAFNGVTDMLIDAYEKYENTKYEYKYACEYEKKQSAVKTSTVKIVIKELKKTYRAFFVHKNKKLEGSLAELSKLLSLKRRGIRLKERIVSFGERLSAITIAEYLNVYGINALDMNAEECGIIADGRFEHANCLIEKTVKNFTKNVVPKIKGRTIVITGFYGVDEKGNVNTFGRGGSDYSAALVARASGAQILEIWKDVEGFMTANPRIVTNAKKLDEITFDEAKELGYLGAKILHPRTMDPLEGTKIFVEIKSVFAPTHTGTRIVLNRTKKLGKIITSIAIKKGMCMVNIMSGKMVGVPGIAAQIFSAVAKKGVSIDTITTSQVSITFTIEEKDFENTKNALAEMAHLIGNNFEIIKGLATIGVVGAEMDVPNTAGRVFGAIGRKQINIELISQACASINITLMVLQNKGEECVRAIHDEFELGKQIR
ncbi:MAG: aspartate kinase [Candidatus Micrarchaeota archaeon]